MRDLVFFCNPASKRNKKLMPQIERLTRHYEIDMQLLSDVRVLPELIRKYASQDRKHLLISGGDGTVQTVLTAILRHGKWKPRIFVLGGGMTNVIARDIGEKKDPIRSLKNIAINIQAGNEGTKVMRRTLKLTQSADVAPQYGFLVGGIGFYSATMFSRREIHRMGVAQMLAANLSVIWSLFHAIVGLKGKKGSRFEGEEIEIAFDHNPPAKMYLALVLATTLSKLLPAIHPFWGKGSGAIQSTLVTYPPYQLWRAIIPALRGKPKAWMERRGYISKNVDYLQLKIDSPLLLDGETIYPNGKVITLESGPNVEFYRYS